MVDILDLKEYLDKSNDIRVSEELPLIGYDNEWPLPDKLRIEPYITELKVKDKLIKVERLRLVGRISRNSKKPITNRWYKGNLYRHGLNFYYKNKEIWVTLKSNWPTNIKNIPLRICIKNNYLYYITPKGYIGIWYKYGRNRINFTIIPRLLKLNRLFWETFGILYGEMLKKGRRLSISNTEPLVIRTIIKFFNESSLLPRECWGLSVSINSKNLSIINKKSYEKKIKEHWGRELNIPSLRIKRIYWYTQYNSTLNPNFGEVNLDYNNLSLFKFILKIIWYVEKEVLNNRDYTIHFIRGLISAEGSSDREKDRIGSVNIASKYEKERKFYAKLCKKIGLKANLYKGHNIKIFQIENFIKILEYRLFDLNLKRKQKFLFGLNKMTTIKALYLLLKRPLVVKEIVKILKLNDYRCINKNFSKLTSKGYLKRNKGDDERYIYKATPNLKRILTLNAC